MANDVSAVIHPVSNEPITVISNSNVSAISVVLQPIRTVSGTPTIYTYQTVFSGTVSSVAMTVQGSLDGEHWANISNTTTSTSGELSSISFTPAAYVRANLSTFTGAANARCTVLLMVSTT